MKYQLAALVLILPLIITSSSNDRSLSIRHSPNLGTSKRKTGKSKKTKRAKGAKQAPVNNRADATFKSSSKNNSTVGSLQEELSPLPLVLFQENPSEVSGYIPLFKLSYCAIIILCELF